MCPNLSLSPLIPPLIYTYIAIACCLLLIAYIAYHVQYSNDVAHAPGPVVYCPLHDGFCILGFHRKYIVDDKE